MNKTVGLITMEKTTNAMPNSVGSSRIRMRWLLPYWEEAEEYHIGKKYETLVFQKAYWKEMMEGFDGKKIFDICDPDWLDKRPVFEYFDLCDAVVTSSEALRDYILKMRPDKKVVCIPDRVYLPEHDPKKTYSKDKPTKVVWFGYSHNIEYLIKTFDFLIAHNIEIHIISNSTYNPPIAFKNLKVHSIPYNYDTLHDTLKEYDIALLPDTNDNIRGKFKTNNKTLTCWALGLPVAKTPDELLELLNSAEKREEEGRSKRKLVEDEYDVKISAKEYQDLINSL